jgi:uncharacterized membrane protein YvbJ
MFCPRCNTNNNMEQKFCRHCGLPLTSVQLALKGNVDEAINMLKKGNKPLAGSLIALSLYCLITIITIATNGRAGFQNMLSAVIFLAATIPFLIIGIKRYSYVNRLLNSQKQSKRITDGQPEQSDFPLPAGSMKELSISKPSNTGLGTEDTTQNLKPPEQIR